MWHKISACRKRDKTTENQKANGILERTEAT